MADTAELLKRAHQGDKEARDRLVLENTGLVWSIVKRFAGRGCETEDLFQIGSIGLIKAIDHFDLTMEVRFSTYAVPMITGEIRRFLRDDGMLKVSRSLKELAVKIGAARERLESAWGGSQLLRSWRVRWEPAARRWPPPWKREPRWNPFTAPLGREEENSGCLMDKIAETVSENDRLLDRPGVGENCWPDWAKKEQSIIRMRYF